MNKAFNKKRIWRKTYGKVFITRKAICIGQMAMANAIAVAQINAINGTCGNATLKAIAVAENTINIAKSINDASHKMNKGFATK